MEKTVARVQSRIANGEYYEAHQAVRTVAARYIRQKKWVDASHALYSCGLLLARAGELGSVSDLIAYLLTVYTDGAVPVDSVSKGRLAQLVLQLSPLDTSLGQLAKQAEKWTSITCKGGDADIHHLFGSIIAQSEDFLTAEHHLLLGTRESAIVLAEMHKRWAAKAEAKDFGLFASRGVFGYLSVCDMRGANAYLEAVLPEPESKDPPVYACPLLNFLRLLVAACARRERALYHILRDQYNPQQYQQWAAPIAFIEENYFGIQPQREFNIMDLMGGFLK